MALGMIDVVTAIIDSVVSKTTLMLKYDAVKKHGKKQIGLQQISHQGELANKAKELALSEQILTTKGRTAILEDTQIKKVVGLGTVSLVLIIALAFVLVYTVGGKK